jgi:predicted CXXCH cytochrome family protein
LATTRSHENAARLALLGLACAASLFAGAVASSADNGPHVSAAGVVADTCASCHRAHTSTASRLLVEPQPALCYTCHGSSATGANTDVEDGIGYSGEGRGGGKAGALRGGGFAYALIGSGSASGQQGSHPNPDGTVPVRSAAAGVTSTHSANSSGQTAWGNGPISATVDYGKIIPLRCGSCHDPHGSGNYRALRSIPSDSGAGTGVAIPDATKKVYTTANYWQVEDASAPGFIAGISAWCATCHTRYLSATSYTGSGDAVFTKRHRSDQTSQGSANCIQCHVAHGSNASAAQASSGGVHSLEGVPSAAGSYLLRIDNRGVCQMCHGE